MTTVKAQRRRDGDYCDGDSDFKRYRVHQRHHRAGLWSRSQVKFPRQRQAGGSCQIAQDQRITQR